MKIAIVDDDKDFIQKMREYIARWQTENNTPCTVQSFTNAVNFLEPYSADWDIVFLDIEMPLMNGLEAAKKLRKTDKSACLIFVTSMAQYAINGYEVDALDYVIKPVSYTLFCDKMQRAINYLKKFTKNKVFIRDKNGKVCRKECEDSVYAFLRRTDPDIICLQEYFASDTEALRTAMETYFHDYDYDFYVFSGKHGAAGRSGAPLWRV